MRSSETWSMNWCDLSLMPSVDYVLCIIFYIIYIYDVIAICDFIEFDYTHKVQGVCYNLCDIHPTSMVGIAHDKNNIEYHVICEITRWSWFNQQTQHVFVQDHVSHMFFLLKSACRWVRVGPQCSAMNEWRQQTSPTFRNQGLPSIHSHRCDGKMGRTDGLVHGDTKFWSVHVDCNIVEESLPETWD